MFGWHVMAAAALFEIIARVGTADDGDAAVTRLVVVPINWLLGYLSIRAFAEVGHYWFGS